MGRYRRWSQEEVNAIIQQYTGGATRQYVAKQFGTKGEMITDILKRNGITIRPPYKLKLTPEQESNVVRRYLARERTASLQAEFGITANTIRKILKRYGHGDEVRSCGGRYRDFSPDEVGEMARLWKSGLSQTVIARQFSTGQTTVSKLLSKAGFTVVSRKPVGEKHGSWKGGRVVGGGGYIAIRTPSTHRFASMATRSGYVPEHRLVMAEHLGRTLSRSESVHHINGDITDNRIENLQLRQGQHGKGIVARCLDCGSHNVSGVHLTEG